MADAYMIGLLLLAGLYWAVRWMAEEGVARLDNRQLLGLAMLVGMAVLGFVVVLGLRGDSTLP
jgi:hypothetical protein